MSQALEALLASADVTPVPSLLNHRMSHPDFGPGVITFFSTSPGPLMLGVTFSEHATVYGSPYVLKERGISLADGQAELPVFPARVNGHDAIQGLGSCEHAARRDILAHKLQRAA